MKKLIIIIGIIVAILTITTSCDSMKQEKTTVEVVETGEIVTAVYSRAMFDYVEVGDTVVLLRDNHNNSTILWGMRRERLVIPEKINITYHEVVILEKY